MTRESNKARAVREEIAQREEEVNWTMRIGENDEQGQDGEGEDGEEEEDLFGDNDEVDEAGVQEGEGKGDGAMENPRKGWTVKDYVRFMGTGVEPTSPDGGGTM